MEVIIEYNNIKMELSYDSDGYFKHVKNLATDKYMMIEMHQRGFGYEIKHETFMMSMDVCDARYIRVMDADLFIPRLMMIPNTKE